MVAASRIVGLADSRPGCVFAWLKPPPIHWPGVAVLAALVAEDADQRLVIEGDRECFTECEGRGVNNQLVDRQPWLCQVAGWAPAASEYGSPFGK